MADIELNALGVKSDSIPDGWLITLVDPTSGAVAKNMTVAKFVELFTQKQPEATSSVKGLMPSKDRIVISDIYKGDTDSKQFFRIPAGQFLKIRMYANDAPAYGFNVINFSTHEMGNGGFGYRQSCYELHVPAASWGAGSFIFMLCSRNPYSGSTYAKRIVRAVNPETAITDSYFISFDREVYVSASAKFQESGSYISVSSSIEGGIQGDYTLPERGVFTNIGNTLTTAYSLEKNALTDTISLNNSFLPPPPQIACQKALFQTVILRNSRKKLQTVRILQYQLNRKNTSGRLRKSDRLFCSYKKKINNLNKSSISITRYSKCNLPRAGPPRLIQ